MTHLLIRIAGSDEESTLQCFDGCGRTVVVGHQPHRMTVVQQGDRSIPHHWKDIEVSGFGATLSS